jgi:hypothetical protein
MAEPSIKERVLLALIDYHDGRRSPPSSGAIVMGGTQWLKFRRECGPQDDLMHDPRQDRWTYSGLPIWLSQHVNGPAVISAVLLAALKDKTAPARMPEPSYGHMGQPCAGRALEDPILY